MKYLVIGLLLISNPLSAQDLPKGYKISLVSANLFDASITCIVLESNKNSIELNRFMAPFANSTPELLLVKGAIGVAEAYAMNKLSKKHSKAARIVSIIGIVLPVTAGLYNLHSY